MHKWSKNFSIHWFLNENTKEHLKKIFSPLILFFRKILNDARIAQVPKATIDTAIKNFKNIDAVEVTAEIKETYQLNC